MRDSPGRYLGHVDIDVRTDTLRRAYRFFNDRAIDDLFVLMTEDVRWPDVAHGSVLHGKDAIRRYWTSQFEMADPQVLPTDIFTAGTDLVAVVDQRILDHQGQLLAPATTVFHRYTFRGPLISQMVVFASGDEAAKL